MNLCGIPIIENSFLPEWKQRMLLSEKVQVTDEFRQEMNAWLLEFFGKEPVVLLVSGAYFMHPNTQVKLKQYFMKGGAA